MAKAASCRRTALAGRALGRWALCDGEKAFEQRHRHSRQFDRKEERRRREKAFKAKYLHRYLDLVLSSYSQKEIERWTTSILPTSDPTITTVNIRRPPPARCSRVLVRIDDDNDDNPIHRQNTALKWLKCGVIIKHNPMKSLSYPQTIPCSLPPPFRSSLRAPADCPHRTTPSPPRRPSHARLLTSW